MSRDLVEVYLVIRKILETWDPPLLGQGSLATCVQTASMISFAYALAENFPWERLSATQLTVIEDGLRVFLDYKAEDT